MVVSINGVTPKWFINVYKGKSYKHGWFKATPTSGNHHMTQNCTQKHWWFQCTYFSPPAKWGPLDFDCATPLLFLRLFPAESLLTCISPSMLTTPGPEHMRECQSARENVGRDARCQEFMSERMSEYMPERMSDRISEYIFIYTIRTSRWYFRNYAGIEICHAGDRSKLINFRLLHAAP